VSTQVPIYIKCSLTFHSQEYEREELALVEHRGRGLGLMKEEWHGASSGWFGGNIEQCATLTRTDDGDFGVLLRPPLLTYKSRIVSRFLGSRRMLQLSLKSLKTYDSAAVMAIRQFLASPLELLGRRFVLFHIKENKTAWFIETTHTLDEQFSTHASDRFRYPLEEVINWWNSLWSEDNSKQVCHPFTYHVITGLILTLS
jgi:RNA-dependent RNA polymerase